MSCRACGGVRLGYCLMRCMAVLSGAWNSFLLHFLKCSLPPRLLSCKLWKMCVSIQGVDRAAPAMCQEQWLSKSRIWDTIWVCDCSCRATAAHPLISASVAICAHCPSTSHCYSLSPQPGYCDGVEAGFSTTKLQRDQTIRCDCLQQWCLHFIVLGKDLLKSSVSIWGMLDHFG